MTSGVGDRKSIHCLLVGDPGMGKSEMLLSACRVSNRGVFTCAGTSSAAGLSAVVHQEASSGGYTIEAGALVLADNGACFIDELDKSNEQTVLYDAMERQSVSLAKAGVICSLPARCSIMAAANPPKGQSSHMYDQSMLHAPGSIPRLPEASTAWHQGLT